MSNGSSFNVFLPKKYDNFLILDFSSFTAHFWKNFGKKESSRIFLNKQILKFDKKYR
jgi:hypothetical protein